MLCPLKLMGIKARHSDGDALDVEGYCEKEKCAWWSNWIFTKIKNPPGHEIEKIKGGCSIKLIAERS